MNALSVHLVLGRPTIESADVKDGKGAIVGLFSLINRPVKERSESETDVISNYNMYDLLCALTGLSRASCKSSIPRL
jgi:hypothetical protein